MRFQSLDQIVFRLPVPIGAIVRLTAKVLKTTLPSPENGAAKAHIMVKAEVQDVETGVSIAGQRSAVQAVRLCADPPGAPGD